MATPARQQMEISAITVPDWQPVVESVEGRFVEASNATLLGETTEGVRIIYKPVAGARPLRDFDASTLAIREVWTHRIDLELNLSLVPETVMATGPYGPGAVQRFVHAIADQNVIDMINTVDETLWPIAVLDLVINNADRKAGHVLRDEQSRLWAIDHGLTFHVEDKLRTVLWGFAGQDIPQPLLAGLAHLAERLDHDLGDDFANDMSHSELEALRTRVARLLEDGTHPLPPDDRPAVPWPPY
ncbi:MAG: SCO1664 family protein [bacterium]|nr:SCO1664 family protein [bacterium]